MVHNTLPRLAKHDECQDVGRTGTHQGLPDITSPLDQESGDGVANTLPDGT